MVSLGVWEPDGEGGGGCQERRDQARGRRMRDGAADLGPLPHPAGASACDPAQGTLAVRDGLFDSLGEQLRPGKQHSRQSL